ncbi:MAG: argininosuccinate lyase [Deltaproteobacteria bacterium]|nr:MAG: argininosuccinate lyase [Deltaproteobacteria bacterium]
MKSKGSKDYWRSGRLKGGLDKNTLKFISSMDEDKRIADADIRVNEAHILMLHKQGLIGRVESVKVLKALEKARKELEKGVIFQDYQDKYVDIHQLIEQYVLDYCGVKVGGKLHLAKSRNDQVMTDLRIYLRREVLDIIELVLGLNNVLLSVSRKYKNAVMPGYTHTQQAQVTTYSHYLLSYVDTLSNDLMRLFEAFSRINLSPLGAGALAGSRVNIDRRYTSKLLGFDGMVENNIEAVSSKDFILEIGSVLAILMTTLSRIASDLVFWSTSELNMIELSDEFSDISSAMPQKKNPDSMEMIRSKAANVLASSYNLFTITNGLITGYHKDFQELKPALWRIVDDVKSSLGIMKQAIKTLKIKRDMMAHLVVKGNITALDLAEFLAKEGSLSFREGHFLVGSLVKHVISTGSDLTMIDSRLLEMVARRELKKKVVVSDKVLKKVVDPVQSISARSNIGSPRPREVGRMIKSREDRTKRLRKLLSEKNDKIKLSEKRFKSLVAGKLAAKRR